MCEHGTMVPMPIDGRVRDIDACLALLVATLNTVPKLATVACCCGHGKMAGRVALADGRELVLMSREDADAYFSAIPHNIHGEIPNAGDRFTYTPLYRAAAPRPTEDGK